LRAHGDMMPPVNENAFHALLSVTCKQPGLR
jgi:hypothetical protein